MTSLVDATNNADDLNELEKELGEAVSASAAAAAAANADDSNKDDNKGNNRADNGNPADDLPAKYKGKSVQEIIEMHKNLESAYGRMANDLGTQRKLTDRLLDLKRADDLNQNSPEPAKVTSEDLLDDPTSALDKYFESRSGKDELSQRLAAMEAALAHQNFVSQHPDYMDIANDPAFVAWVQKSPYRLRAAQYAYNGDYQAASELLDEYKSANGNVIDDTNDDEPAGGDKGKVRDNLEAARKVALEKGGQGTDDSAPKGKVWSRAALMRLKIEKPHVYEDPAFQEQILAAYAEGRVK